LSNYVPKKPEPKAEGRLFVKRARETLKLTQIEFAEMLGLSRWSIMRFEQGEPLPHQTRLAIRMLLWKDWRKRNRSTDKKWKAN
jgi:DNA-binding XRE family transcriptional regulator